MYSVCLIILLLASYFIAKKDKKYRNILIWINSIVAGIYMIWRFTTIPIHNGLISFILGLNLYLAEVLGLVAFFNFQFLFLKKYKLEKKTLEDYFPKKLPNVDVLICTYNEPLELLEKTIVASLSMDYAKNKFSVYVCDDGRRESLKRLCKKYNVNYITREDNEGAKAGNINNALKHTKGELFAVLDADMIPKKEFLKKTVGYFVEENVAFVQTPQVYYNQDMYQYNLEKDIPNEQDFFMRDIEEARAARDAVLHVGTNAIFRKSCIEEIGYYPTDSITEDMAVGMLLQAKGYTAKFINEVLVLGLSATTFAELVKQRDRWCRGNLQVMKKYNPLFNRGLNIEQKIAYFDGVVYWFSSLQKMTFILTPIIYLATKILIIDADVKSLVGVYLPFFLGQMLIFRTLSTSTRSLKWSHYYEVAMAPHISYSVLREMLCLKTEFNVTSKDIVNDKKQFQFKVALPHILLVVLSIIAWVVSGIQLINHNIHIGAFLINIFWSIYNFLGLVVCIKVAYQKPIYRSSERIEVKDNIKVVVKDGLNSLEGSLFDISEKGLGVKLDNEYELVENEEVDVTINKQDFKCKVVRNSSRFIGITFGELDVEQMKVVVNLLVDNMAAYYEANRNQEYIEKEKYIKNADIA